MKEDLAYVQTMDLEAEFKKRGVDVVEMQDVIAKHFCSKTYEDAMGVLAVLKERDEMQDALEYIKKVIDGCRCYCVEQTTKCEVCEIQEAVEYVLT